MSLTPPRLYSLRLCSDSLLCPRKSPPQRLRAHTPNLEWLAFQLVIGNQYLCDTAHLTSCLVSQKKALVNCASRPVLPTE